MSDVQFEEENNSGSNIFTSRKILGVAVVPGMAKGLIRLGLVKTQKQAEYVMFGIIIVCVAIIIYFNFPQYFRFGTKSTPQDTQYQEDIPIEIRNTAVGPQLQYINSLPHRVQ